jgi:hypothetical protein
MKHLKIFTINALIIMLFSCQVNAQNEQKTESESTNKIEVIDFHSTHRCMTCNAIEANTKYTLNTSFADELKEKIITFQSVNIDEEVNYKMAEKFEASGTSLFLNVIINGEETIINLTDFAFSKGRQKEAFSKELKSKIETELEKF